MVNYTRLVELAKESDVSLAQLSRAIGMADRYIADCMFHKRDISGERLDVIADKLNTTAAYLRGESDIKMKKPTGIPDRLWENIISDDAKLELANWIAKASDEDVKVFLELARRLKK